MEIQTIGSFLMYLVAIKAILGYRFSWDSIEKTKRDLIDQINGLTGRDVTEADKIDLIEKIKSI